MGGGRAPGLPGTAHPAREHPPCSSWGLGSPLAVLQGPPCAGCPLPSSVQRWQGHSPDPLWVQAAPDDPGVHQDQCPGLLEGLMLVRCPSF